MKRTNRRITRAGGFAAIAALLASAGAHGYTFLIAAGAIADGGRR